MHPKKGFPFQSCPTNALLFRVPSRVVLSQVPDCVTKRGSVAVRFSKQVVIHGPYQQSILPIGTLWAYVWDAYGLLLLTRSIKFHCYVIIQQALGIRIN